jgi:hypothetical protein
MLTCHLHEIHHVIAYEKVMVGSKCTKIWASMSRIFEKLPPFPASTCAGWEMCWLGMGVVSATAFLLP